LFFDEGGQHVGKATNSLRMGRANFIRRTPRLDHQIDRPVLQMQPLAIREHRGDGTTHEPAPSGGVSGQG
jgi:hypothetical protein